MANVKLTRLQIKLVDEAAELAAEMKTAADRLEVIKKSLGVLPKGIYTTPKSVLSLTERDNYEGPTPKELHDKLKDMGMKARFMECVKVLATESKKIIGEEAFNSLRKKLPDATKVMSFKQVS